MQTNRTKIIATLGPASFAPAVLRELVQAGTNVFRINFSHVDYSMLQELIQNIRTIEAEEKKAHLHFGRPSRTQNPSWGG